MPGPGTLLESLARLGYASKAFVYGLMGTLAAMAAFEYGGDVTDSRGALRVVLGQPFGTAVLFVLALGLCGYAAWRVLDAVLDPERHGTDAGGLVERVGNFIRGLIYGGVGLEAFRLARGLRGGGGEAEIRSYTARALALPLGEWLVGAIGLIVAAYGASQIVGAIRHTDDPSMRLHDLSSDKRRLLMRISRFGVAARALIVVTVGVFLVRAAVRHDPGETHGVRESVVELAGMSEGRWALAAIAFGLIAYAVDQALHAKYKRIRSPI
jgi:hypothetical protein